MGGVFVVDGFVRFLGVLFGPSGPLLGPYWVVSRVVRPEVGISLGASRPNLYLPRPARKPCKTRSSAAVPSCHGWRVGLAAPKAAARTRIYLPSSKINNKKYNLNFGFWAISGRTWPRGPFKPAGLDKWCRNHSKLTPGTNSKAASWPCSGPEPQLKFKMCH